MSTINTQGIIIPANDRLIKFDQFRQNSYKGWVVYQQSGTPAVENSSNVSSVTDTGSSGRFDVNFTTNFAVANGYLAHGSGAYDEANSNTAIPELGQRRNLSTPLTTSSALMQMSQTNSTGFDCIDNMVLFAGELA